MIERQAERVDAAFARAGEDADGGEEVRTFTLRRLREAGDHEVAVRLAGLWGMKYKINAADADEAARERRKRYIQLEDVLPGSDDPILVSTPELLIRAFELLLDGTGPIGFDAEWGEDKGGVALLQLATSSSVVLVRGI